jgi:succinoglycan biosynthesis protein ExoW
MTLLESIVPTSAGAATNLPDVAASARPLVAVVVPYFQRRPGILRKALASALAQEGGHRLVIIIVDDGSPVPARAELAQLTPDVHARIVVIERSNAGPAAARNTALRALPADTDFVAFLDSDDEWIPQHLARAVAALAQGHDFYFADHYQLDQTVSAFRRAGRIDPQRHPALAGPTHLHAYQGDMFDQILSGNVIGTSTVVYRHAPLATLRFREEFVYAGEDYLFWLEASQRTARIAFSALCECVYGEGVNIFAGSGWGSKMSLLRLHHEMKFQRALSRLFALSAPQRQANLVSVRRLRRSFVADMLHRVLHRQEISLALLARHFKVDPQTFIYALPLAVGIALGRGRGT